MAALALVGAMMTGCSNEDSTTDTPQQPANTGKTVTLTTTVGLDSGTRALDGSGNKTFAEGDEMAVIYKNTNNETMKAVGTLTDGAGTASATFTFTLTDPDNTKAIRYIYPAAMAKDVATDAAINDIGTVDYDKLNNQDGTLATLGSNLDLCTLDAASWTSGTLPTGTLDNQLAILAVTLKDADGSNDITSTITGMTNSDGTNYYAVNRTTAAGPIYVAIFPTADATITVTATDGTKNYTKTLTTSKTYAASNGYNVSWLMPEAPAGNTVDLSTLTVAYEAQDGETLTGTLANNVQISIADGATVILNGVSINAEGDWTSGNYAGITCLGDATIILSGTNTVKGFNEDYPGIYVPEGSTVTIKGSGSLTASSNGFGAGIGGGFFSDCGNIEIQGGTITATGGNFAAGIGSGGDASCGTITISDGTVTATGGDYAAGIGSGCDASCGNITISGGIVTATGGDNGAAGIGSGIDASCGTITITSGVTSVTATKGSSAPNSIGAGDSGSCDTVTIGGVVTGNITESPYTYQP